MFTNVQPPCSHPSLPLTVTSHNHTVTLLARSDSVTGTIVVGEYKNESYRFLRADHSLLGGQWIGEKTFGKAVGESIYGAFTLQEAVRLIEKPKEKHERALIM